jgi:phosphopantothenoylcysteine decarboxylase/phosphopantothenate--cysteine ligase
MAAAVADFRPSSFSEKKLKKGSKRGLFLRLVRNPDILSELGKKKGSKIIVGYSLETDDPLENAKKKMRLKHLDMVVANKAGKKSDPFGKGRKNFNIICKQGLPLSLKAASKEEISHIILDKIDNLW